MRNFVLKLDFALGYECLEFLDCLFDRISMFLDRVATIVHTFHKSSLVGEI